MTKQIQTPTEKTPSQWAADGGPYDCSSWIGDLGSDRPWQMLSYSRPGNILWRTIAAELHNAGWSDDKIRDWLSSTAPRHCLDGSLGEMIEDVAREYAANVISWEG